MNRKMLLPLITLCLVSIACSLFAPSQAPALPTATPGGKVQATSTPANSSAATTPDSNQAPAPSQPGDQDSASQPVEIKGTFSYSNKIITTYYVEQAVALVDMYGFVTRNQDWEIPVAGQVLGYLKIDSSAQKGTFDLMLPMRPDGQVVNVDPTNKNEKGLQVYAVSYWPNLAGGPYSEGDDPSHGWPSFLASVITDSGNQNEVVGGKLVIWAADDQESFPSGFGADGKLFSADDPVMKVPAGYSVINLDQKPFDIERSPIPQLTLYEPKDVAIKDFSKMTYSDAFKSTVDFLKKDYAFNGIPNKSPDFDKLYTQFSPAVADADQKNDPAEFAQAMFDFSLAFKDGHTGINGATINSILRKNIGGGFGFAARELDDKRVIVTFVLADGPAAKAGMQVGAELTQFNGKPVSQAIGEVKLISPESSDFVRRYDQMQLLVRAPVGAETTVSFTNPKAKEQTAKLQAVAEIDSYTANSPFKNLDQNGLPVTYKILADNVGYIQISSNFDDLNLIIRLFQRALQTFQDNNITALIIDMRTNVGGSPLGLEGFLNAKEITLGQLLYYSDTTGKFQSEGEPDKFTANQEQYHFDKMITLVDIGCASACELESYGFSKVPGMIVMGEYPTSGTEAEVSRGQIRLPDGMSLQVPTGRFVNADGSLFLEGQGVQPTIKIPITADLVLSKGDPILDQAVKEATRQ